MEPLIEFLGVWWWTVPATVGAGAIGYAGLTTGRRRARRLALDAARLEERLAVRGHMSARAATRAAQAEVLRVKADDKAAGRSTFSPSPQVDAAKRALQQARIEQRAAAMRLRASRAAIRAERARLRTTRADDPTPLRAVVDEHDAIVARWLEYETDIEAAIAFPQMSDPQHPATVLFLHAMQRAQWLRPRAEGRRTTAQEFAAYRAAVLELGVAFEAAEEDALRAAARSASSRPAPPRSATPDHASQAASRESATQPASSAAAPSPDAAAPAAASPGDRAPATGDASDRIPQPVWPVPGRPSRQN